MLGLLEVFIFMCIFGYFIGKNRTNTMIDILTTRFHDAYTYLLPESNQGHNMTKQSHKASIKRPQNEQYVQQKHSMKENHSSSQNDDRGDDSSSIMPIDGLICQDCSKTSKTPIESKHSQLHAFDCAQTAVDILKVTQHASTNNRYDWGTYFTHLAQNVRLKKYDYQPIFDQVLNHKRVQQEVERVARDAVRESDVPFELEDIYFEQMLEKYKKKAHVVLLNMRSTLSDKLLRLTSYVLYKLLPWFLSGVVAHPAQIEMLKIAQKKMPNTPLIFLPMHRSHLDYILVTFILLNNDIRCPQVVAGDNLNIPVFGYLLRGLGAVYIKRKIDGADGKKDYIYRGLLQTYLQESLRAGHNLEFFIEGGRTRTGKPCLPKGGILSVIVDAFVDGLIDNALLVPVSVNYEKLVDGDFVREQMGTPKRKESFRKAIRSIWKVLNAKYGQMRIDFNEPFSLKELVKTFKERKTSVPRPIPMSRKLLSRQSINSAYGIEVNDKHRALVDNIGRHVVYDCCAAMSVMSTNIVAFLLLNKHRNGATLELLALSLTQLREQIGTKRDFGFDDPSERVIMQAIELLGPDMVERMEGDFIVPILTVPNVIETFYYSNTFVPYFALDAAVTNAIAATLSDGYSSLTMSDVIDATLLYCDVLRYEFIFHKPCQNFSEQIEEAVQRLRESGVVSIHDKENVIELNLNTSEMLLSALAAFNITYWLTAECLCGLFEKSQMLESDFIKMCVRHITEKFESGCITYGEAISTDSIKNCLKVLEKWAVVEVDTQSGVRIMSLTSLYNSQVEIQKVVDKLDRYVIFK